MALGPFLIQGDKINSYSASRDNWCTGTLWNRIITAQCEGMGEVGSARYEPALLPPCPSIRVLSYSNCQRSSHSISLVDCQKFSTLRVKFSQKVDLQDAFITTHRECMIHHRTPPACCPCSLLRNSHSTGHIHCSCNCQCMASCSRCPSSLVCSHIHSFGTNHRFHADMCDNRPNLVDHLKHHMKIYDFSCNKFDMAWFEHQIVIWVCTSNWISMHLKYTKI